MPTPASHTPLLRRTLLSFALGALPFAAHASGAIEAAPADMATVVISASGFEQTIREAPASITVVNSNVTTRGSGPRGFGVSGGGIVLDATDEQIVVNFADLVQDQIARTGVAWPKGDARGVLRPVLTSDVATWTDGDSVRAAIGDLAAAR